MKPAPADFEIVTNDKQFALFVAHAIGSQIAIDEACGSDGKLLFLTEDGTEGWLHKFQPGGSSAYKAESDAEPAQTIGRKFKVIRGGLLP